MAEDVRARVQALSEEIRALKASLKERGLSSSAINADAGVQARVAELRELKAQLPKGDDLTDQAFFEKQRKEQDERDRQRKLKVDEERRLLQAMERSVEMPLVQRKIFHLFQFAGSGDAFHYEPPPRLNAEQTGFGGGEKPCPAVYVTEKWDGTTMQATSSAIFRRQEIAGKKRSKDPAHRYELKLVAWREDGAEGTRWRGFDFLEADKRVVEALTPHLDRFQALDGGLCVYFECVHSHVNATYSHLEGFADIRVFDFSRAGAGGSWQEGRFLPFDETIELAQRYGLPIVGWDRRERLAAPDLWAELEAAAHGSYATVQAPLEGFVVREACGDRIAKARVEHIKGAAPEAPGTSPEEAGRRAGGDQGPKKPAAGDADPTSSAASCGAAGAVALEARDRVAVLSTGHLEAVGLLPSGWRDRNAGSQFVLSAAWEK